MTTDTHTVTLSDLDSVLPPAFELLPFDDPRNEVPYALRAVRDEAAARTHYFYTPLDYLKFVTAAPRRILADVSTTRYVELSHDFDADVYWHPAVTVTMAGMTRWQIILHRMKSEESSVKFELSRQEFDTLVSAYQSYLADCERADGEWRDRQVSPLDPFVDDVP